MASMDSLRKYKGQKPRTSPTERNSPVDRLFDNKEEEQKPNVPDNKIESEKESTSEDLTKSPEKDKKSTGAGSKEKNDSSGTSKKTSKAPLNKERAGKRQKKVVKERALGGAIDIKEENASSWNCKISKSLYRRFELLRWENETSKSELINRMINQERIWLESHPEFPDEQFKSDTLDRSLLKENKEDTTYTSFALTPENHKFIKKMSSLCYMKMYAYVCWLIEQYCDLHESENV